MVNKLSRFPLRQFWDELRRRHVVRVAFYYAAFAWIVIQVGDVLFDAFELSHLLRFLVAIVVGGLLGAGAYKYLVERFLPDADEAREVGEIPASDPVSRTA